MVSTFGSARICSKFLASSASMVAPRFKSLRNRKTFSALLSVNCAGPPVGAATVGGEYWPVDIDPMVLVAPVLMILSPNCWAAERSTSAKRTFKRI